MKYRRPKRSRSRFPGEGIQPARSSSVRAAWLVFQAHLFWKRDRDCDRYLRKRGAIGATVLFRTWASWLLLEVNEGVKVVISQKCCWRAILRYYIPFPIIDQDLCEFWNRLGVSIQNCARLQWSKSIFRNGQQLFRYRSKYEACTFVFLEGGRVVQWLR